MPDKRKLNELKNIYIACAHSLGRRHLPAPAAPRVTASFKKPSQKIRERRPLLR